MKKSFFSKTFFLCAAVALALPTMAQKNRKNESAEFQVQRPKIVVGFMVDQMCWDYLYRYRHHFGQGGFQRLLNEGFNCDNALLNYVPSVTAIGHSSVYTGSVPAVTGIAGNNFVINNKKVYCTQDDNVRTIGAPESKAGRQSPHNMLTTTFGDELRLATNFRSKVISIAIKDRASVLPGGHLANGAYWFDDETGGFITSSFYMEHLPQWVNDFNARRLPDDYLSRPWNTLYPRNTYLDATADANGYEKEWDDQHPATLPLDLPGLKHKYGYKVIRTTPMGNTLTIEFAKAAINGEQLGQGKATDLLALSLSSTDYIGHRYGVDALETEDCYVRLDKDLEDFFNFLDKTYGKNNYVFFITADHAAPHNITYMQDKHVPAGAWSEKSAKALADSVAHALYPEAQGLVNYVMNYQIFLNTDAVRRFNVDRDRLLQGIADAVEQMKGVAYVVNARQLHQKTLPDAISMRIQNGYRPERSGDLFVVLNPGWMEKTADYPKGITHGVWAPYDAHIPLIFMGKNIPAGHLHRPVYVTDIAPTLTQMLYIQTPNGCVGQPITEMLTR